MAKKKPHKPKEITYITNVKLVSVTAQCTTVSVMGMQSISVAATATFSTPTTTPSGMTLTLTSPTAHLQSSNNGGTTWNEIQQQPMNFVSTNNYSYTFSGQSTNSTYRVLCSGTWCVTGNIADSGIGTC